MANYIALLRKQKTSDYGVEFPDFPGCVAAGRTLEEAHAAAREALELHLEGMAAEGLSIAEPSSLDTIFESDWETEGSIPFLIAPKEPEAKVVRVNVTFKPTVLADLDSYAQEHHLTRAAALESAVRAITNPTDPLIPGDPPDSKPALQKRASLRKRRSRRSVSGGRSANRR